ncbi:MAG: LacI family transcriptional regulator [Propionibacteriaceae bacterium]|nr:LacI family transcriptional regulator [Propionibacteriaceae bacterium]
MIGEQSRRSTLHDVARLADVSIKTVSRVINGEPNVAPTTAQNVRDAIEMLHYLPDAAAANLARTGRETRSIALLIPTVDNQFFARIFHGVEQVAHEHGFVVFAASTDLDLATEESLIRIFASRQVDGFIIAPAPGDHRGVMAFLGTRMPCVFIDQTPAGVVADVVTVDNAAAAREAVTHLLHFGHRRIGFMGDDANLSTAYQRRASYEETLRAAGVVPDSDLEEMGICDTEGAEAAVRRLLGLTDPATAIFASRNMAAIGAVRVLQQMGLSHRVALVGMGEIDVSDLLEPPLTVMAQDPLGFGRLAAQRLFERIDGHDETPRTLIAPAHLVTRGSGEILLSR